MTEPLLIAERARVDVDGSPVLDGLDLRTTGAAVAIVGAPRALFEAVAGMRPVRSGALRVAGASPETALAEVRAAASTRELATPPGWSAHDLAWWSARLVGHGAAAARANAAEAVERLQMAATAATPLKRAPEHVRRVASVAAALATGAPLLLLEDPTEGLALDVARTVARLVCGALEGRSWVLFASRLRMTSPFAHHSDEVLLLSGARVLSSGPPAELATRDRQWSVRVEGAGREALAGRLRDRGAKVDEDAGAWVVDLPEGLEARDVVAMATEEHALLLEITPIAPAFA